MDTVRPTSPAPHLIVDRAGDPATAVKVEKAYTDLTSSPPNEEYANATKSPDQQQPCGRHQLEIHVDPANLPDDTAEVRLDQKMRTDGRPKRPMNAFLIYSRWRRQNLEAAAKRMTTKEISSMLGTEWKHMDEKTKDYWRDQSSELRRQFSEEHPKYRYTRRTRAMKTIQAAEQTKKKVEEAQRIVQEAVILSKAPSAAANAGETETAESAAKAVPASTIRFIRARRDSSPVSSYPFREGWRWPPRDSSSLDTVESAYALSYSPPAPNGQVVKDFYELPPLTDAWRMSLSDDHGRGVSPTRYASRPRISNPATLYTNCWPTSGLHLQGPQSGGSSFAGSSDSGSSGSSGHLTLSPLQPQSQYVKLHRPPSSCTCGSAGALHSYASITRPPEIKYPSSSSSPILASMPISSLLDSPELEPRLPRCSVHILPEASSAIAGALSTSSSRGQGTASQSPSLSPRSASAAKGVPSEYFPAQLPLRAYPAHQSRGTL